MNNVTSYAIGVHARVTSWPLVDQPTPNLGGPGVGILQNFAGIALALALIVLVLGGIIACTMIGVGHTTNNGTLQTRGLKGVGLVVAAAILLGSIAALINWGASQKVM